MHNAAIDMEHRYDFISFGYTHISSRGFAESQDSSILNFLRNSMLFFIVAIPICISTNSAIMVPHPHEHLSLAT